MKEGIFTQQNPQFGPIIVVCRILGKIVFFKFNNSAQAQQVISQLKSRGADIEVAKEWVKVDMFKGLTQVKLGEHEFDVTEKTDGEIEQILYDFFVVQYKKAGFRLKEK